MESGTKTVGKKARNGATYRATRRNLAKTMRKALGARTVSEAMDLRVGLRWKPAQHEAARTGSAA